MSIENGRRAELKKKLDSKKSLSEIIINVLSSEPKTLDGIIKGINERMSECNRRTAPSRKGLILHPAVPREGLPGQFATLKGIQDLDAILLGIPTPTQPIQLDDLRLSSPIRICHS